MSAIEEREYEYMKIIKDSDKTKTSVFLVLSKRGDLLGQIRWWPSWRRYCLFTLPNRVLSQGCMTDVCSFIDELKEERRNQK